MLNLAKINKYIWYFGLAQGLFVSLAVSLIIVLWEWLENPNGIFHGQQGTHWDNVFDTAISWFVPTFIYVALIIAVVQLIYSAIKWLKATLKSESN